MVILHLRLVVCSVLFSYVTTKQGRLLCAVSTHKSKNGAPIRYESTKSVWGQINFSPLPLVMVLQCVFGGKSCWKLVFGQSDVRSGNSITTRCVVNADILHTLLSLVNSKHRSPWRVDYLRVGRSMFHLLVKKWNPFSFSLYSWKSCVPWTTTAPRKLLTITVPFRSFTTVKWKSAIT